jgi:dGTPase
MPAEAVCNAIHNNQNVIPKLMTNYSDLLKIDRRRPTSVEERSREENIILESESDRGRILYCAAFRRLQQKAQVFSLESNAAVRSRLTHSLEVSQIGRYIADTISRQLAGQEKATPEECFAMVTFVENACLMHDIGNPPFGHFGEAAIRKWFEDKGKQVIATSYRIQQDRLKPDELSALSDFLEFDGNPQGLRVVTRLQWNKDEYGLNLTHTTLAAYLKYVRMAGENIPETSNRKFIKKAGYFSSEKEIVDGIWNTFGYKPGQRFPLAYIMEAADDIAYCVSDLEDSIEKGLVSRNEALTEIKGEFSKRRPEKDRTDEKIFAILNDAVLGKNEKGEVTFTDFRTALNRALVEFAANNFVAHQEEVFNGTLESLLPKASGPGAILTTLKDYCKNKVYRHESVQRTELAGYTAIYGLLNHFQPLLECSRDRFARALDYLIDHDDAGVPIVIEKKYLALFPQRYIKVYRNTVEKIPANDHNRLKIDEWNARAHLIVDFISGMTDDFAMTTYQTLSGMRL